MSLSGALTDAQVGAVIASLGEALWLFPEEDVTTAVSGLVEATRQRREPANRLDGGLRLHVGGTVLNPGRGCAVSHWRNWYEPGPQSATAPHPWWGWPPYTVDRTAGGGLRITVGRERGYEAGRRRSQVRDGMVVELGAADLRAALTAVEASLRGATRRIHDWVRRHAPARLAAPATDAFAFHTGLARELNPEPLPAPVVTVGCMASGPAGWIRLHGGMPDVDVAQVVENLLHDNGDLTGGLIMTVAGEQLHPDCCCSVRQWRWLREDLDKPGVDLSWGHGPTVRVKTTDGQFEVIDRHGLTRAVVDRPDLAHQLDTVEADLIAATARVHQWLAAQDQPTSTDQITALFAAAVGLA